MDALKKAEEEKKQAAKRLQDVEKDSLDSTGEQKVTEDEIVENGVEEGESVPELFTETSQFSLEPLSLEEKMEEPKEEVIDESENALSTEGLALEETLSFSEGMTMENTILEEVDSQETFEETQKEIDLNDTAIIEGLSTEDASAPYDDTFHGVVFEEESETDIYEETLPGVPADTLARDLGEAFQSTPVAAKTVFSAGKQAKKKSSFKWSIFVVLALLAVGSFAIFYYFTITPVSRNLPSPLVARGIEFSGVETTPIIIPPVVKQAEVQPPSEDTVIEQVEVNTAEELAHKEIVQKAFEDEKSEKQALVAEFDKESIESAPEIELIDEKLEVNIPEEQTDKVISAKETVERSAVIEESMINKTEPEVAALEPEKLPLDSSLINISKSKKLNQENTTLAQAFKAYQAGSYDAAESLYQGVLKSEPDNRDAHLGLAAIAINNQNRKAAYSHYVHLLELNPLDTLAMSSLIALSNSPDPVKDESAIKLLIQRDDSISHLHFLLGNIYAKQKRWADAQQAFFDAYRLDSTNSDYMLNLAISLDQLGQYKTALDYYKSAIELPGNTASKLDTVSINRRILSLSKLIETKQ